jgi:ABC-2 type transport system ATP-binding protein
MDQPALACFALTRRYGDKVAVDGLDLGVRRGEFYAFLGPNGAGKTTTLRMAVGLLEPDEGRIEIFGADAWKDPIAARRVTAWLPDEPLIYDRLSPLEYLDFVAGLWGIDGATARTRGLALLERLGLGDNIAQRCGTFSRGMKQKTALAGALVHDPQLIILDEPLTGLDANAARDVKTILRERVEAGATVVLTTHILEVAERLSDRIGIIACGRLHAEGSMAELRARVGRPDATLEDIFLLLTGETMDAAEADPQAEVGAT